MPSAFDLIGHNPALLEHWVHRFLAALIDGLVVAAIYLLFVLPVAFLGLAWHVAGFLYGLIWLGYSVLLEAFFGATIGIKLLMLRVVAIDGHLDILHTLALILSTIYWVSSGSDLIVGVRRPGVRRLTLV